MIDSENGWAFINTNIWFYAFTDNDLEKHRLAVEVIKKFGQFVLVSTQVINELCLNLKKKADFRKKEYEKLSGNFSKSTK